MRQVEETDRGASDRIDGRRRPVELRIIQLPFGKEEKLKALIDGGLARIIARHIAAHSDPDSLALAYCRKKPGNCFRKCS